MQNKSQVHPSEVHGVVCRFLKEIVLRSVDERPVYTARGEHTQRMYVEALHHEEYWVDFQAQQVLKRLEFLPSRLFPAQRRCEIWIFRTTQSFQGMTRRQFFDSVTTLHRDMAMCPPEVGPELRLQYPEQRHGEVLSIAMQDLMSGATNNGIFLLANTTSIMQYPRKLMVGKSVAVSPYVTHNESWVFMKPL